MLWFGVSVMDDGFVYNIHHSSLTYPSRIQDASFMRKRKSCVPESILFPLMEHGVSLKGTKGFP